MRRELLSDCFSGPALQRLFYKWEVCGECAKAGKAPGRGARRGGVRHVEKVREGFDPGGETFGGGQAGGGSSQSREAAWMGCDPPPKHQKTYLRLRDQNIPAAPEFPSQIYSPGALRQWADSTSTCSSSGKTFPSFFQPPNSGREATPTLNSRSQTAAYGARGRACTSQRIVLSERSEPSYAGVG